MRTTKHRHRLGLDQLKSCGLAFSVLVLCSVSASQDVNPRQTYEPSNPRITMRGREWQKWQQVPSGLQGSFASIDRRYAKDRVPELDGQHVWSGSGWRGERLYTQIVVWSATGVLDLQFKALPVSNNQGEPLDCSWLTINFVRYVLSDNGKQECGPIANDPSTQLLPDILDTTNSLDLPALSVRPIWVSIDIPPEARPGRYRGKIVFTSRGNEPISFALDLTVIARTLPPPADWSFHLDLWQNPFAVARYHHVPLWSDEHWLLLKPLLTMLAEAGQKCITTSIVFRPWAWQTYDAFESMVEWTRKRDGSWQFDYTIFDQWVEFCQSCGITQQINCYSMVPWSNSFRYFDEASSEYKYLGAVAGTQAYETHWRPFLLDFARHLQKKGWLDKTSIAMDERPLDAMKEVIRFVNETAPQLKITLAGRYHPEIKFDLYDYCITITQPIDRELIKERVDRSLPTTYYVACHPRQPNTFTFSPPAEAAWLGWFAAARGFSGFLRWAYCSWVEDPLKDTRFVTWPAGDCFFVYPGPRSSIRFERLREGIQDYEKIRILQHSFQKSHNSQDQKKLSKLTELLDRFQYAPGNHDSYDKLLGEAKQILLELSQ